MRCHDFCEIADSYLGDELLIETNHDVIAHLESCAACRRELAARRNLRTTLRTAFVNAEYLTINDDFAGRLAAQLRASSFATQTPKTLTLKRAAFALAACLLIAFIIGVFVERYRHQSSEEQTAAAVAAANITMNETAELAVGDHRNCAVQFRLPEKPIDLDKAGRLYDASYVDLKKIVSDGLTSADDSLRLVEAHSCVYQGKRFAHVIFKSHDHLISFLVTTTEGAQVKSVQPTDETASAPVIIAADPVNGYQVSSFQTERHAVFVISDLNQSENLRISRMIAPAVYKHISQTESAVAFTGKRFWENILAKTGINLCAAGIIKL